MVGSLSGGNQQKVVLAKWRIAGVHVLILDHPTRGIDVGAKEDVYELVRDMTAEGLAVILLGDTLEEVIGLSNRILVMRDGEVTATFEAPPGAKPAQVDLIRHMV
jgi:ribose transport system ATP-binding protein